MGCFRIAHEISRTLFKFKRFGFLEITAPTSLNGMQVMYVVHSLIPIIVSTYRG
jgi:hypothetical protein